MGSLWQPWMLLSTYFSKQRYTNLEEINKQSNRIRAFSKQEILKELNLVNRIAWPMILVSITQFLMRLSPMFMLGHVDDLSLSSASIAITFCNVSGFSVIFGMSSALETLCGQAYGAEQYKQVGTFTYTSILCLLLVCIPISLTWIYTDNLLIFVGQEPLVSIEASKFAIWLIPAIFPYAILQSLIRYLQTQSLVGPMLLSSFVSLFVNLLLCWAFVFKLKIGSFGGALAIGLSYWVNVVLLGVYVKCSLACERTCGLVFKDVLFCLWEFLRYAIPSALMVCLEWWSFELIIFLSGLLPNPQLEMSVLSVCMTFTSLHFNIPYSFGVAASTRISNELGAGNVGAARVALYTVLIVSVAEFVIAATVIYMCHHVIGYIFSEKNETVRYIEELTPLLCISIIMDSLQALLSGVARGGGWQGIGAYINLGSYYIVGIPVALIMGFLMHLKGKGLWIGLVAGSGVQCLLFSLVTTLIDWDKQATEARQRIFEGRFPAQLIELN